MPLDTRITIEIAAEGHRNQFGEYVPPGNPTLYPVWADTGGVGISDTVSTGGVEGIRGMAATVRWFRELVIAPNRLVHVIDAFNLRWEVDNINTSDQRRRWIGMYLFRLDSDPEGDG